MIQMIKNILAICAFLLGLLNGLLQFLYYVIFVIAATTIVWYVTIPILKGNKHLANIGKPEIQVVYITDTLTQYTVILDTVCVDKKRK